MKEKIQIIILSTILVLMVIFSIYVNIPKNSQEDLCGLRFIQDKYGAEWRQGDAYIYDGCGNLLYMITEEELNNAPIPMKVKFDDDGMGFIVWDETGEEINYKVSKAWDVSTAIKVEDKTAQ